MLTACFTRQVGRDKRLSARQLIFELFRVVDVAIGVRRALHLNVYAGQVRFWTTHLKSAFICHFDRVKLLSTAERTLRKLQVRRDDLARHFRFKRRSTRAKMRRNYHLGDRSLRLRLGMRHRCGALSKPVRHSLRANRI